MKLSKTVCLVQTSTILTNPNHSWCYQTQHIVLDPLSPTSWSTPMKSKPTPAFSTLCTLPVILPCPQTAQTTLINPRPNTNRLSSIADWGTWASIPAFSSTQIQYQN